MPDHYGTLEAALTFHAARGNAAWSAAGVNDTLRTAAMIRAAVALDGQYGARYPGTKTGGRSQVRGWPQTGAVDHCAGEDIPDDEVPVEIEEASYSFALAELVTPGILSPSYTPGEAAKREKAGEVEVEYFAPPKGVDDVRPVYAEVESGLRCILKPKGTVQCLLRA